MIEEFQYDGEWWTPEEQENKIRGTLYFSPTAGIKLELLGSFKSDAQTIFEIILGSTINGKKITLTRCMQYFRETHTPGGEISKLKISELFVGEHFQKIDNIKFDGIIINYSHLDEWAGFNTFDYKLDNDGKNIAIQRKEHSIEVKINKNLKLKLCGYANFSSSSGKKFCVKHVTFFEIKPSKKLEFNKFRKYINILQNLLILAVGDDVAYPLKLRAFIKKGNNIKDVYIYYLITGIKDSTKSRHFMLFTYDMIRDRFDYFIKNWFENHEQESLKEVLNLYFATIHNQRLYVTNQFLNYIMAIEAFHRHVHNGKYIDDNKYEEIRDTLIKAIPNSIKSDHRMSLKNRIKYGNEFSLRKRLTELCKEYKQVIPIFIEDKKKFIGQTIDTRNFLTHNDPKSKGQACDEKELIILNSKTKILLELCILNVLGFNKDEIKSFFSRFERYQKEFINNPYRII